MGKWVHRLVEKDLDTMTGVCVSCGPVRLKRRHNGVRCQRAETERGVAWKKRHGVRSGRPSQPGYRAHLKGRCERCGFVPEGSCRRLGA